MVIDWKDPLKELPPDGAYVAALSYHWKECWPLSAEILFGEVESYTNEENVRMARVNTRDFTGGGAYQWNFPIDGYDATSGLISAWAYAKEFIRPSFLNHNPHWGKEK